MKKHYYITVPKPCHEDWNKMSQRDKGKFCSSCSKIVIDFTKMNTYDIQDFIHQHMNSNICGHFKQTQLDSINLHIPYQVLVQKHNFHKVFLLALIITMGTSLMNCTNMQGNQQKIESIEIIDTLNNNKIDILGGLPRISEIDSIPNKTHKTSPKEKTYFDIETEGELIIQTVGEVDLVEKPPIDIDTLETIIPPYCPFPKQNEIEGDFVIGFIQVQNPPEFKNTPQNLSIQEKKAYFSKQISKIISKNFNTSVCSELSGKQRIHVQFKIDEKGNIIDIKARAPHPKFEIEAIRVIKLLPQFISAKQRNKPISVVYTLPIIFQIEE